MRRPLAKDTEVVDRGDNPTAKKMLPDSVGHHAGREGIVGRKHPLSKFQSAASM